MLMDRDYIFTLYSMGVGAVFRYLQQIEDRVEDAEARRRLVWLVGRSTIKRANSDETRAR